jgi:glycosyltransferase involved in cell wall biosynthesis
MDTSKKQVRLSYVTSTMNKLPYLKIALNRLFDNVKEDEEILIADGGSTDGTKEYLEELLGQGKIDYFVSEKDAGESHALNKLFMKAQGELITLITDDDAFNHPAIQACKKFMLEHPHIDMVGTDGGKKDQDPAHPVKRLDYVLLFQEWQKTHTPFMCCGLGLMMRRASLAILGFWNPTFSRADAEFMLRVTSGKAQLAWYSGPSFVNISNPQSITKTKMKKILYETQKLEQFYLNKHTYLPKFYTEWRSKLGNMRRQKQQKNVSMEEWIGMLKLSEHWLDEENRKTPGQFLFKA